MVVLSEMEEKRLLDDYSNVAWKLVHRFSDGKISSLFSQEDLYQECMLVLLKHMNNCETKEELRSFHPMNLINAMSRYVLRNQAVKLDSNRTAEMSVGLENCAKNVPLSDLDIMIRRIDDPYDEIIEEITFEQFMESKTVKDADKEILSMLKDGYRVGEIADMTGRSHQVVSYSVRKAKRKYDAFVA